MKLKNLLTAAAVSLFLAGGGVAFSSGTAHANEFPAWDMKTVTAPAPSFDTCPNLKGFAPNEDEASRAPKATVGGVEFSGNQLFHHAVSMDLKDVKPGSYDATPAPKNNGGKLFDDFFSIEVSNPDAPHLYGTLRYELTGDHAGTWNIGGTSLYSPVNSTGAELEKFAKDNNRSTNVVSYGIGYPNTPSDGEKTLVKSITFHGVTHSLTCAPTPVPTKTSTKPTIKPSTSSSTTAASHTGDTLCKDGTWSNSTGSGTCSHHGGVAQSGGGNSGTGTESGALAITGTNTTKMVVFGGLILVGGVGALVVAARRRRVKFSA